ncbi:hypothetical protein D3C87_1122850 [compost metagenome]
MGALIEQGLGRLKVFVELNLILVGAHQLVAAIVTGQGQIALRAPRNNAVLLFADLFQGVDIAENALFEMEQHRADSLGLINGLHHQFVAQQIRRLDGGLGHHSAERIDAVTRRNLQNVIGRHWFFPQVFGGAVAQRAGKFRQRPSR